MSRSVGTHTINTLGSVCKGKGQAEAPDLSIHTTQLYKNKLLEVTVNSWGKVLWLHYFSLHNSGWFYGKVWNSF